jgi:hypothetical protein
MDENQPKDITTGKGIEIVTGGSVADILKMQTGEANKEAPHLTVPFYMPLVREGAGSVLPALRNDRAVEQGIAHWAGGDSDRPPASVADRSGRPTAPRIPTRR